MRVSPSWWTVFHNDSSDLQALIGSSREAYPIFLLAVEKQLIDLCRQLCCDNKALTGKDRTGMRSGRDTSTQLVQEVSRQTQSNLTRKGITELGKVACVQVQTAGLVISVCDYGIR